MSKTSKFRMSDRSENSAVYKDSVGAEKDMLCGAAGGDGNTKLRGCSDDEAGGSCDVDFSRVVKKVSSPFCYLIDYQNLVPSLIVKMWNSIRYQNEFRYHLHFIII